jgi:starch phosphorylase
MAHHPELRSRLCFIDDYDMGVSRHLLQGADIWLNTPLRPQEACGTSGMKAAFNGALNCSVLDGWWDECFEPDLGWAIASAEGIDDLDRRNELEANSVFDLLEQQIVPLYYDRGGQQIAKGWVGAMKRSICQLAPRVHSARMVRDYVTDLYQLAAAHHVVLESDDFAGARELAGWRRRVLAEWHRVHVDEVEADESVADLSTTRQITARVALGDLRTDEVEVQVVCGLVGQAGELEQRQITTMSAVEDLGDRHHRFTADLDLDLPGRRGLTVRVVPRHDLLVDPLELGCVAWAAS